MQKILSILALLSCTVMMKKDLYLLQNVPAMADKCMEAQVMNVSS